MQNRNQQLMYLRSTNNTPFGCIMAEMKDGEVKFSLSLCSKNDTFSKKVARNICTNRMKKGYYFNPDYIIFKIDIKENYSSDQLRQETEDYFWNLIFTNVEPTEREYNDFYEYLQFMANEVKYILLDNIK